MKDEPFNRHIEAARHSLQALRGRLRTIMGAQAPGVKIAEHLGDIGTALDAVALEWSQQRDALAALQTKIAEGARVELALRASEGKFRAVADYTVDWESWIDTEGRLLWVNPAVKQMTGYTAEECLAMPVYPLPIIVAEDRALIRRKLKEALQGKRGDDVEFRIACKGGVRRWGAVSWRPIFGPSGQSLGHRASVRDITRRKQAEEALKKSVQLLRDTGEMAKVGGWELDLSTKQISWTEEVGRIHGVESGYEPKLKDALNFYEPEFRPVLEAALKKAAETGEPYDLEWFFTPSGSKDKIWVRALGRAVYSGGKIAKLAGTFQNIDKYKRAEVALRESEARLHALFENSMVGILLTAPDGRVFAANPAACRMFARTEADICRLGRSGLVNRRDARANALVRERMEKKSAAGEMTLVRADGTCFPAQVASMVFETAEGPRASIVIQDLSERKRAEMDIRDFSRKLLSVREEEKRRISAVLHHDVGSFTVGVTAYLNAAEGDLRNGKYKEGLASLKEGHRLFVQSVRRLKTLAVELRPPDLDILGLPAALRQHLSLLTNETSLRVCFTDATDGMAISPETQTVLFRVVQESLNNVVKHAHARQVRVRLSASRKTLRLSIVDDGKGFDPAGAAAEPGTHMGLRAAQEMVAALGGEFMVDAAPGRGTTVLVTVPQGGPKT